VTTDNTLTRRQRAHRSTCDEILQIACQQMAEKGAAALSLRAIARQMQMTAPALYRYFKSRDELVTALIVTAYHSLANALEAARDSRPADDHAGRLLAACLAYRHWALAHPQDYALIFGTPIPGYVAPFEVTQPAAKRSMDIFAGLLEAAERAGKLKPAPVYAKPSAALQKQLGRWKKDQNYTASTTVLHLALVGWSRLHGLVLLELFHHLVPFFGDASELYRSEVEELLHRAGLKLCDTPQSKRTQMLHRGQK
jgi:AcrR family transcriptional regulator